jgi:hypothetical protein
VRWVLLWTALLVGAAVLYGVLGLRLWRAGKALVAELGAATARLDEASVRAEAAKQAANGPDFA